MCKDWQERGKVWLRIVALLAVALVLAPVWVWAQDEKGNVVFFRGGFAGLNSNRAGEVFTDAFGASGRNDGSTGYYVGAGLDLLLSKDFWGMMKGVWAVGEIGVEFKRFSSVNVATAVPATCSFAGVPTCTPPGTKNSTVQLTMLTVDIAPKIKFLEGSRLRPWVIPLGLDFHVISPPSNQGGYLDIGVQFGAGAEYQLWKELKLGVDGRYHLASNQTNTVNNFGTVGMYVGIGF